MHQNLQIKTRLPCILFSMAVWVCCQVIVTHLKTNSKTICSQVWQPGAGLPDENFNKKPNSVKKRPGKSQRN